MLNANEWLFVTQQLSHIISDNKNNVELDEKRISFDYIKNLSELNAGDTDSIKWYLSEAVSPNWQKLEMVDNVADYRSAVKEIIKDICAEYLRNLYNFLETNPAPSETEQEIKNAIQLALIPVGHTLPSPEQTVPHYQPA